MAEQERLLRTEERIALEKLAIKSSKEGARATALLALDDGATQAGAASSSGLSTGQVQYAVRKFREQRLLAIPGALAYLPADREEGVLDRQDASAEAAGSPEKTLTKPQRAREINRLLEEIDALIGELRSTVPVEGSVLYSPLQLLTLVRSNIGRFAPRVQLHILQQFEGMTREDLRDPDTWKGIAYVIAYSAQFQATQTKEALNERLPEPLKPDTVLRQIRKGLDRVTPEIARDLAGNLEGASREDLLDADTWKGMVYMIAYSAQFQTTQARDKLNEQLPEPFKPDTVWRLFREALEKVTPEVARQIVGSFEGASREDLLDPDTWKGVWYMVNYSLQFQATQVKHRLLGEEEE